MSGEIEAFIYGNDAKNFKVERAQTLDELSADLAGISHTPLGKALSTFVRDEERAVQRVGSIEEVFRKHGLHVLELHEALLKIRRGPDPILDFWMDYSLTEAEIYIK
jgi:hypothetical protein